jgi:hypothetical protein
MHLDPPRDIASWLELPERLDGRAIDVPDRITP